MDYCSRAFRNQADPVEIVPPEPWIDCKKESLGPFGVDCASASIATIASRAKLSCLVSKRIKIGNSGISVSAMTIQSANDKERFAAIVFGQRDLANIIVSYRARCLIRGHSNKLLSGGDHIRRSYRLDSGGT